jgi:hypothetical protein
MHAKPAQQAALLVAIDLCSTMSWGVGRQGVGGRTQQG